MMKYVILIMDTPEELAANGKLYPELMTSA